MRSNSAVNHCDQVRMAIPERYRDMENWPSVDEDQVAEKNRSRFNRLVKATTLFLKQQPLKDVLAAARMGQRQYFSLLDIALTRCKGADEINGTRAFVKGMVQRRRLRLQPYLPSDNPTSGYGGLFSQLLREKPEIEVALTDFCNGKERPNKVTPRILHAKFLRIVRDQGVQEDQYPFVTKSKASRPLQKWYVEVYMPKHLLRHIRKQHGKDAGTAAGFQLGDGQTQTPPADFGVLQIDEFRDDQGKTIIVPNGRWGDEHLPVACTPVLRCRSIGRVACNVAWTVCLAAKASGEDVIQLLKNAVLGQPPAPTVDPSMKYMEGAGFPANVFPRCKYSVPLLVMLDNDLAHLRDDVQNLVTRLYGGRVLLGIPKTPKGRPDIESSIGHVLEHLLHQLPNTMGTGPKDPVRKSSEVPVEKRVPVGLLEQALDVYFANQNVMPSAGAGYLDSFTRLGRLLESGAVKLNYLPESKRLPHHFSDPKAVVVHCNLEKGRLPHVNFLHRRYSSPWLKSQPALNGRRFWALADYDDLRTIVLCDDTMATFATLNCEGQWGLVPHDMRMIKIFSRYKADAQFQSRPSDVPLFSVLEHLTAKGKEDTAAATDLAYILRYLRRHIPAEELRQIQNGEFNESALELTHETTDDCSIIVPGVVDGDIVRKESSRAAVANAAFALFGDFQAPRRLQ